MSSFTLSAEFKTACDLLRRELQPIAEEAMEAVVAQAEKDAKAQHRWRQTGSYSAEGWEWEVTGIAERSLFGYVVGRAGNAPTGSATARRRTRKGEWTQTQRIAAFSSPYRTEVGRVVGVLTMLAEHSAYLQQKEISGGVWGAPSAGLPITQEVFAANWANYYAPRILKPKLEALFQQLIARF